MTVQGAARRGHSAFLEAPRDPRTPARRGSSPMGADSSGPGRIHHSPSFLVPITLFMDAAHFLPGILVISRFPEIPPAPKVNDSTGPSAFKNPPSNSHLIPLSTDSL